MRRRVCILALKQASFVLASRFYPYPQGVGVMTQAQLDRAVARATGEALRTISSMGFVPLANTPVEHEPQIVDWDELDARRYSYFPQRQRTSVLA
jgi:hypothetical protein